MKIYLKIQNKTADEAIEIICREAEKNLSRKDKFGNHSGPTRVVEFEDGTWNVPAKDGGIRYRWYTAVAELSIHLGDNGGSPILEFSGQRGSLNGFATPARRSPVMGAIRDLILHDGGYSVVEYQTTEPGWLWSESVKDH